MNCQRGSRRRFPREYGSATVKIQFDIRQQRAKTLQGGCAPGQGGGV
jgi:hypothetical protein